MSIDENEKIVINRFVKGDITSFDELYKLYYNKIYSFSYSYLRNKQDSEGVVQEVFITLWNNRNNLQEIKNLNGWLFTVTLNMIRKIFRSQAIEKRNNEIYAVLNEIENPSLFSSVEFNDLLEKTQPLINKLSPRQKSVLLLRSKEGLSSTEIAEKLNINKRTVENHLTSARALLMKMIKDEKLLTTVLLWLLS